MVAHIRIGQGMDVHAFEEGRFVTLAGIQIPHTHGLKAHSDGCMHCVMHYWAHWL